MKNPFKEVIGGFISLVTGMRITLAECFKPTVTVQYPHESLKMPARFRGHIELVRDPETGKAICYACKLCERACPSECITVDGAKAEGAKKKSVTSYKLDFTKCSLCGSCVEACRDSAIRFSRDYNKVSLNKEDFVMDLFKRLEDEAAAEGSVQSPKSKVQSQADTVHSPQSTVCSPQPAATPSSPPASSIQPPASSPQHPPTPDTQHPTNNAPSMQEVK